MKPLKNKLQLDIKEITRLGASTGAIEEHGMIIGLGNDVDKTTFQMGQTIYFKTWAVDIITDGTEKHYFISDDSDAICAHA